MNDELNIQNILGYAANDNPLRASKGGESFEGLIPAPTWTEETVNRNGSVSDTVQSMAEVIKHYHWQAAKIAPLMKGATLYDTCRNIWEFLFKHIRYNEDTPNKEELRTFARSFAQRRTGIDCDDFSIGAGSILYCLNIPFLIRIARYAGVNHFQHVYIVVPDTGKRPIIIDAVLDNFDQEKPTAEFKDTLIMSNTNLNGINISVLGEAQDQDLREVAAIISGTDFSLAAELEGLGSPDTEAEELVAIKNHLQRTRDLVNNRPELVAHVAHPGTFLGMIDYALKYWDTDKREEALGVLEGEENRMNELEGLAGLPEGHESVDLFYGLNSLGSFDVMGKAKAPKKFFTAVKQAVKTTTQKVVQQPLKKIENKVKEVQNSSKVAQKITKVATKVTKNIVKFNPASVSIRAAILLALKTNVLKIASKLKWGYLTEAEAKKQNLDIPEWGKARTQLAKIEKLFVDTLQGNAANFKNAILQGRAGRLSGADLGLGDLGVAVAAASTAAATPFLMKIIDLMKVVDFNKLIAKIDPKRLAEERKLAETDAPVPEGGSAIPENTPPGTQTPPPGNEAAPPATPEAPPTEPAAKTAPELPPAPPTTTPATTTTNTTTPATTTETTPATTDTTTPATTTTPAKANFIDNAVKWVKDNPKTSIVVTSVAAFVIYQLAKPKKQAGLNGVEPSKRKKKRKKSADILPTISGTQKPPTSKRKKSKGSKKHKL